MSTEAKVPSCPWSSDDDKLLHFASLLSRNWKRISIVMRKSERECHKRFVEIVRMISSNRIRIVCCYACTNRPVKVEQKIVPKWTESNDRALMRAVSVYGVRQWHKVAAVAGFSARCCEVRWKCGLNKVFADGVREEILRRYGNENDCNEESNDGTDEFNASGGNDQSPQFQDVNNCDDTVLEKYESVSACKSSSNANQMNMEVTCANLQYMCCILSFMFLLCLHNFTMCYLFP